MQKFRYTVTVTCETEEQANTVMGYRCNHDEEIEPEDGGPFDYSIIYDKA